MSNLSQIRRDKMIEFLDELKIKNYDDESALIAINEIQNEINSKKYGLVWEEHEEKVDELVKDNIPVFQEVKDKEINDCDSDEYNFLLEGDNLHSLKLLEKTHKGKIDVIYIDPPYNTKNKDFIYDDNMIGEDDSYRHSKWLSFMEKRLLISRKLLSDDGIIFISIDDNEQANLTLLCNSIFGEQYVECNIWSLKDFEESTFQKTAGHRTRKEHEYLITIMKNKQKKFNKYQDFINYNENSFSNPDNDPRGDWFSGNISRTGIKTTTGSKYFEIITPAGVSYKRNWTLSRKEFDEALANNRIYFAREGKGVPRYKVFKTDKKETIQSSIFSGVKTSISGKNLLKNIFGKNVFDYPKPIQLIQRLLTIGGESDSIILDFFAGSGTTGHAVMELNKEDGGNRKFILCTNNENNIAEEITYERIKRVSKGYGDTDGIPTNLKYYKTDFVPKLSEYVSDDLLNHTKEMVQLENGIKIEDKKYKIVLTDEDADDLEKKWDEYKDLKAIYISKNVLLNSKQNRIFSSVEIKTIPDYYFASELKEVGELW